MDIVILQQPDAETGSDEKHDEHVTLTSYPFSQDRKSSLVNGFHC